MKQQQIHCTKIKTVQNEHLFTTTVSFVRVAGVFAKGRMLDMPAVTSALASQQCYSRPLGIYRQCASRAVCTGYWWGSQKERCHWGDPDVDGRIILKMDV
jgi:hypothetical protein